MRCKGEMMTTSRYEPRVSIGMPVYNGERYLAVTLDSLLTQTFEDFELIICDNASMDQTEQICRSYAARDGRIRYVRHTENLGAAKNYWRAFELAVGGYFRWANCDDLFAPESLARCVEVLDREQAVVLAYPQTQLIDERGQAIAFYDDGLHLQSPKASDRFVQLFQNLGLVNVIYGLMRTDALKQTGLIRNFVGGDIPLIAELTLYGKFWEIPEALFYRRLHAGAQSNYREVTQIQKFFDPKTEGQIPFREWRHLFAHYGSVLQAPLGIIEKIRLGAYLARQAIWSREELTGELVDAVQQIIHRHQWSA
jgi:glycosyltransferase involved in cell wall biosynthesis